jgi:hypothetical protein
MGLDITAYSKMKKLDVLFNNDGEPVDPVTLEPVEDYYKVRAYHDFSGRADGLEDGACYSYAESEHVFARSYSGYSVWRETLAKLAGYPLYSFINALGVQKNSYAASSWHGNVPDGAPFVELVNFSDCEGCIGPVVAAKLLRDFVEFDDRAKAIVDDRFYVGYCQLKRGLELASDGGALEFS